MRRVLIALLLLAGCASGTHAQPPALTTGACAQRWFARVHAAQSVTAYNAAVDGYNACPGITTPLIHEIAPVTQP